MCYYDRAIFVGILRCYEHITHTRSRVRCTRRSFGSSRQSGIWVTMIYTSAHGVHFSFQYGVRSTNTSTVNCMPSQWMKEMSLRRNWVCFARWFMTHRIWIEINVNRSRLGRTHTEEKAQWEYDYSMSSTHEWSTVESSLSQRATHRANKILLITSTKPEKHLRIIDHLIN